jgi:glutathione S-transferase
VVTETIALLSFIASQYPGAQLLPNDNSVLLARAYELMSWYASSLHVAIAQIWRTERFTPDPLAWSAVRSGGLKTIRDGFAEIETMCTDTWLLGVQYSVVDAYTYVFWRWGHKLGFDMTAYPKWSAHSERLRARPSVAHVLELEKH